MTRDRPFDALSEADIQKAVFQHIELRKAPNVFAFHVANGGFRRPREAATLKAGGVKAGVPDILAIKDGHTFGLELKTHYGHPSPIQVATMQHMQRCGATVAVAHGLDAALSKLEEWGLLQPSTGKV